MLWHLWWVAEALSSSGLNCLEKRLTFAKSSRGVETTSSLLRAQSGPQERMAPEPCSLAEGQQHRRQVSPLLSSTPTTETGKNHVLLRRWLVVLPRWDGARAGDGRGDEELCQVKTTGNITW